MTSELQRQAMIALAETWALSPDVRLGQLLAHLGFLGEVHVGKSLGCIEDDEFVAILARHQAELTARLAGSPDPSLSLECDIAISGASVLPQAATGS